MSKPKDLEDLFNTLRLTKYLSAFQEEEVILEDLIELDEGDLEGMIQKAIPRKRLLKWIKEQKSGGAAEAPVAPSQPRAPAYDEPQAGRSTNTGSAVKVKKDKTTKRGDRQKALSSTEMVLIQGLVQTPHLNGLYMLDSTRVINGKVFYRKRLGKAVLSWQLKPQWKVLKNGDWVTPSEGTGIWYISHDFESDLMVYVASSEEAPFVKPHDFDGVIWEWHERKEQWVKAKAAEIAGLQNTIRIVVDKLQSHRDLNGVYEMVLPSNDQDRPTFVQVEPQRKGIFHWEVRKNFQVLKDGKWVKPDEGVGLWVLSPIDALKDMRMYFGSNELMPFFKPLDYDGCRWEWIPKKNRFDLLKSFDITRQDKFEKEEVMISNIALNADLNGTYVYDGTTNEGKMVYRKKGDNEAYLFWTHKEEWSVRINRQWCKPPEGVGIWNLSKKIRGKILCYFASNETRPYERGSDYDQVVWEWNASINKWNKVKNFDILPGGK